MAWPIGRWAPLLVIGLAVGCVVALIAGMCWIGLHAIALL